MNAELNQEFITKLLDNADLQTTRDLARRAFTQGQPIQPTYSHNTATEYLQRVGGGSFSNEIIYADPVTLSFGDNLKPDIIEAGILKYPSFCENLLDTNYPLQEVWKDLSHHFKAINEAADRSLRGSVSEGLNLHGQAHADNIIANAWEMFDLAHIDEESYHGRMVYVALATAANLHDTGNLVQRRGHQFTSSRMATVLLDQDRDLMNIVKSAILFHESEIYKHLLPYALNYLDSSTLSKDHILGKKDVSALVIAALIFGDKLHITIERMNPNIKSGKDFENHDNAVMEALFENGGIGYLQGFKINEGKINRVICDINFRDSLWEDDQKSYGYITVNPHAEMATIEVPQKYCKKGETIADFDISTNLFLRLNSERFSAAAVAALIIFENRGADEFSFVINDELHQRQKTITFHRASLKEDIEQFQTDFPVWKPHKDAEDRLPVSNSTI